MRVSWEWPKFYALHCYIYYIIHVLGMWIFCCTLVKLDSRFQRQVNIHGPNLQVQLILPVSLNPFDQELNSNSSLMAGLSLSN